MRVLYKTFRGTWKSWTTLFNEAAEYASNIPSERLISISHSADNEHGIVNIWYWGEPERCIRCDYDLRGSHAGRCPECGTPA